MPDQAEKLSFGDSIRKNLQGRRLLYLIPVLLLTLGIPGTQSAFLMSVFIIAGFFVVMAIPYNLLFGYAGEPSLAHIALFGLGAYAVAILTTRVGLSPWLAIPIACIFTLIISWPLATVCFRVSGFVFFLVTLSFAHIAQLMVLNWTDLTGGYSGIARIPHLTLFDFDITTSTLAYYFLVLFAILIAGIVTYRAVNSKFGRALNAIREDPLVAESVGINTKNYKTAAFMIGGLFAGLGGSLYALYFSFVSYNLLGFDYGVFILAAVFVGGRLRVFGPAVGVYLLMFLTEYLRFLQGYRLLIYGMILILCVVFFKAGIVDAVERVMNRLRGKK